MIVIEKIIKAHRLSHDIMGLPLPSFYEALLDPAAVLGVPDAKTIISLLEELQPNGKMPITNICSCKVMSSKLRRRREGRGKEHY